MRTGVGTDIGGLNRQGNGVRGFFLNRWSGNSDIMSAMEMFLFLAWNGFLLGITYF